MKQKVRARTLTQGDVIEVGANREEYDFLANYGQHVAVARHVLVTNPPEWLVDGHCRIEDVSELKVGDKVVNDGSGNEYVVTSIHGDVAIVVSTLFLDANKKCILRVNSTFEKV